MLATTKEHLEKIANLLPDCQVVGFDTESHGPVLDTGKSKAKSFLNVHQSSMTGFSLALPDGSAYYIPLRHMKGENAPIKYAHRLLNAIMRVETVVAHNWKHDSKVLIREGIRPPKGACDTLIAAWLVRPLECERYGLKPLAKALLGLEMASYEATTSGRSFDQLSPKEALSYTLDDARAVLGLWAVLRPRLIELDLLDHFHDVEMPTVSLLRDIEGVGMSIDEDRLDVLRRELNKSILATGMEWARAFTIPIASSDKISRLMYDVSEEWSKDGLTPGKSGAYPADKHAIKIHLARCKPGTKGHECARLLSEYRQKSILASMFANKLGRIAAQYPDGRLHPSLNQTGTATGRFSSSDPNAQQIPAHSELGKAIKSCFVPRDGGYVFVSADYSQLELRYLAHLCRWGALFDAVHRGDDLHQAVADQLGESRDVGKMMNFAVVYGAGAWKVSHSLGCSEREAQAFLDLYYRRFPEIKELKERIIRFARKHEYTKTHCGRIRRLQGFRNATGKEARAFEKKAVNTCIQGSGADVVKLAMLALPARLRELEACIVMQVHDEILIEAPRERAAEAALILQDVMENTTRLRVPLVAEPAIGDDWASCK